jgi:hypothetical protein
MPFYRSVGLAYLCSLLIFVGTTLYEILTIHIPSSGKPTIGIWLVPVIIHLHSHLPLGPSWAPIFVLWTRRKFSGALVLRAVIWGFLLGIPTAVLTMLFSGFGGNLPAVFRDARWALPSAIAVLLYQRAVSPSDNTLGRSSGRWLIDFLVSWALALPIVLVDRLELAVSLRIFRPNPLEFDPPLPSYLGFTYPLAGFVFRILHYSAYFWVMGALNGARRGERAEPWHRT